MHLYAPMSRVLYGHSYIAGRVFDGLFLISPAELFKRNVKGYVLPESVFSHVKTDTPLEKAIPGGSQDYCYCIIL